MEAKQLEERLRDLRREFDHSFAVAVHEEHREQLDFLVIRVASDVYALRLTEVASLHADRRVMSAPSELPELRGIAGSRGMLTPVYDLAALLGYRAAAAQRWLVVAAHRAPIAFAFEAFEAHLRVNPERVSAARSEQRSAVQGAVESGETAVPLLSLSSLIEGIAQRIEAFGPSRER